MLILQFCDGWQQYHDTSYTASRRRRRRSQTVQTCPLTRLPNVTDVPSDRRRRLLSGSTTADTSELWPELAGRTLLLSVVVAISAGGTVGTLATRTTNLRRAVGANSLFVRGGDDLAGEVEPEIVWNNSPLVRY